MDEVLLLGAAHRLAFAGAAVLGVVLLLRWLDRRAGVRFATVWQSIEREPLALAVYCGLRFIGAAVLVGLVLS